MTTLLEALKSIKETLHTPDRWLREQYAADSRGWEVNPDDPAATSFCLMGAVIRAKDELGQSGEEFAEMQKVIQSAINDLYHGEEYSSVAGFNDAGEIEHGDVVKVLDWAIDATCKNADDDDLTPGPEPRLTSFVSN